MKMQNQHFEPLLLALSMADTPGRRAAYQAAGLSTTRYQWDLIRAAGLMPWICDNLYSYLNDEHIQTALNKIVPTL
ncbi:MAG: hypothetical protein QX198_14895 [Methylococcaceae bacterium]